MFTKYPYKTHTPLHVFFSRKKMYIHWKTISMWRLLISWCDEEGVDLFWERRESTLQHQWDPQYCATSVHRSPPRTLHAPPPSSPASPRSPAATPASSDPAVFAGKETARGPCCGPNPPPWPISGPFSNSTLQQQLINASTCSFVTSCRKIIQLFD